MGSECRRVSLFFELALTTLAVLCCSIASRVCIKSVLPSISDDAVTDHGPAFYNVS